MNRENVTVIPTPNRDAIEKWCTVLESGKYVQTAHALHKKDGGRCCLGVACDVYRELTGNGAWVAPTEYSTAGHGNTLSFNVDGDIDNDGSLPDTVREFFGFDRQDPFVSGTITATQANDRRGWSFDRIAHKLRTKYLQTEES